MNKLTFALALAACCALAVSTSVDLACPVNVATSVGANVPTHIASNTNDLPSALGALVVPSESSPSSPDKGNAAVHASAFDERFNNINLAAGKVIAELSKQLHPARDQVGVFKTSLGISKQKTERQVMTFVHFYESVAKSLPDQDIKQLLLSESSERMKKAAAELRNGDVTPSQVQLHDAVKLVVDQAVKVYPQIPEIKTKAFLNAFKIFVEQVACIMPQLRKAAAGSPRGQAAEKRRRYFRWHCSKKSGRNAVEKSGRNAVEKSGRNAVEKSGRNAVEKSSKPGDGRSSTPDGRSSNKQSDGGTSRWTGGKSNWKVVGSSSGHPVGRSSGPAGGSSSGQAVEKPSGHPGERSSGPAVGNSTRQPAGSSSYTTIWRALKANI